VSLQTLASAGNSPAQNVTDAGSGRIPELDALRGLAAIGILALHTMPGLFFWAWSCVDLFFVLSGFLITGILLENAGAPRMLISFYARRILRIWPVYYLALAATVTIFLAIGRYDSGSWPSLPSGQWLCLIFLQYTDHYFVNGGHLEYIWYFAHSWSLAVEEQFYLVWPLLFLVVRPTLRVFCGMALLAVGYAIWARSQGMYFYLLPVRMDGLLFGIVLAFLAHDRNSILYRLPFRAFVYPGLLGLILIAPYLLSRGELNLFGSPPRRAVEVMAFCLIFASAVAVCIRWTGARLLAPLRTPPLLHLGRLSFAIYMYQVPIGYLGLEAVARGALEKPVAHGLTWIITLILAHCSYRYMERHVLALKRFFPYATGAGKLAAPRKAE
jgi:peptidoglycan/LPS O-acetylase OafA/YrhL